MPGAEAGVRELRQVGVQVDHARAGRPTAGCRSARRPLGRSAALAPPPSPASRTPLMRPLASTLDDAVPEVERPAVASGLRTRARSANGGRSGRLHRSARLAPRSRLRRAKMAGDGGGRRDDRALRAPDRPAGPIVDGTGAPRLRRPRSASTASAAGASAPGSSVLRDAARSRTRSGAGARRHRRARARSSRRGSSTSTATPGLMILAEPAPRAQGPRRASRPRSSASTACRTPRSGSPTHLAELVEMNAGLDGQPGHRVRLGLGRRATSTGSIAGWASTSRSSSGTRRSGSATTGWDERRAERRRPGVDALRCSGRRWRRARTGCRPASTTRRARTRRPRSWRISPPWPRSSAASTTRTCATRSATASSTRSARRSTSGGAASAPAHITHFYHRATFPGTPEQMLELVDDARAEGLDVTFDAYPYEWASTRLLITVPPWVQAGGPGPTKERLADPRRPRAHPRRARGARRAVRRRGRASPTSGSATSREPENLRCEGRTLGDVGARARRRPGRRAVRPAARRRACGSTRSRPARTPTASAGSTATRRDGRDGLDVRRGEAVAALVRLATRGSSASSCATRRCCRSRRRSRR